MKATDRTRNGWFNTLTGDMVFIQTWDDDMQIATALGQTEYVDTGKREQQLIEGHVQEVKILKARPCYIEVPYDLIGERVK